MTAARRKLDRELLTAELALVNDRLIATLLRRLREVSDERDRFREISKAAIHALAELTTRHERVVVLQRSLRDELRSLRVGAAR